VRALPAARQVALRRAARFDPVKFRAAEKFRAEVRECFLTHPATTSADFDRCWPKLRDEIFKRHARRALGLRPAPPRRLDARRGVHGRPGGGGNGNGNGTGNGNGMRRGAD
ncbi:MAG TPA: hypothetical protein VER08_01455, partial [Pyrinomonadaceae bacterium]|nr:hypothetical protein [Pyrinomonadaceae bacterium]